MVMACDFWFQALESQAVTSLRFVHCRPRQYSRFDAGRGDILETVLAFALAVRALLIPAFPSTGRVPPGEPIRTDTVRDRQQACFHSPSFMCA